MNQYKTLRRKMQVRKFKHEPMICTYHISIKLSLEKENMR